MTFSGFAIMLLSVGTVTAGFGWCLCKVLSTKNATDSTPQVKEKDAHE